MSSPTLSHPPIRVISTGASRGLPSPPAPSRMASTTASTRFYGTLGSPLRLGLFGESRNVMCAFCFGGFAKAIMVGKVGQEPVQKRLRSGKTVVLFSLGTGGIRNNRRPLDNEEPHQYAERSSVQWHRVCIYPDRLGSLALKHVKTGSVLYLEGNIETKVFSDPITGLVRRIREIAVRGNGRFLFLGNDGNGPKIGEAKGVGYF
ncbi:hypothetical protein ACQJBY_022756 [Aegilops geniculata]